MTYKALGRSIANYAGPVWSTNASTSSIGSIQRAQNENEALRIITGANKMSSIDHLYCETDMLRVEEHLNLLSVQYLIQCLESVSACNITRLDNPLRMKKQTLYTKHHRTIRPLLSDTKQKALQAANTEFVRNSLIQVGPNRVLGYRPPPINNEEAIFPRHQRTVLSQLRSGHCQLVNDYKKRTKRAESSSCNECGADLQDVAHLFACPSHPTNLTPEQPTPSSLWSRPTEAIRELS